MNTNIQQHNGFTIVEMIVAISIVVGALIGFLIFAAFSSEVASISVQRQEATAVAREGIEIVRLLRDDDWDGNIASLTTGVSYYPTVSGGSWILASSSPGPIAGRYDREVIVLDVFRDANDNIAPSGTVDEDTRLVRSIVSWSDRGTVRTLTLETYLTNWR